MYRIPLAYSPFLWGPIHMSFLLALMCDPIGFFTIRPAR